ncbi:MAG: hypothetical protein HYR94_00085, partial [Chloroflexi bacterium]|nr:hypothetical protein [Chloroflexota bacterium]
MKETVMDDKAKTKAELVADLHHDSPRWRRYEFIANTSQEFMTLINQNRVYEAA